MTDPVYLLDVNVLVAMMWPPHRFHERANRWFEGLNEARWATCSFTQAAVVRLLSNESFASLLLEPAKAAQLLAENLRRPGHVFWPMDIGYAEAIFPFASRIVGHRQVTDAYLLGLAMHKNGRLATMDRSISTLLSKEAAARFITEI